MRKRHMYLPAALRKGLERLRGLRGRQLACVGAGLALGIASQASARSVLLNGNELSRNSRGQGAAAYELTVEGVGEEVLSMELELEERAYTREEASEIYEQILEELPGHILGENPSLREVCWDLNLLSGLEEYGVDFRWQSENPDRIDSFGNVNTEGLPEQGEETALRLRMTDGAWPQEFVIPLCVKPPIAEDGKMREQEFLAFVQEEEERQRTEETFKLPDSFEGRALTYGEPAESSFWPLALLGISAALLLELKERRDQESRRDARKRQLLLDYSEVLSRLIIFLGAGMSIRTAWDRIGEDYARGRKEGRLPERYAYEEMCTASSQMRTGIPEGKAFADFGRRCGIPQYIKLGGLLEQNRKNGSKNLRDVLKLEMADAFELRKHQARRLGEEAGTKLLAPLFMLLTVVMVMIAVPALMEF